MPDGARSDSPAVQAQLDRLTMLSPGRDVLGLERITELLRRLGNPQDRLPPVFHVAGTNGKGSTCAFLRAMLEAAGNRVHVYSSPHLVRFNERIRLAGTLIDDESLAPLLAEVLVHAEGLQASFFEVTTAAAFLAFARTPADACIVEVGLGGRLDATNVLARPAVCGIASLGIDHKEFLLSDDVDVPRMIDLERIAFEKAGIAKRGVPLVTMDYGEPINARVAMVADTAGALLARQGRHWSVQAIGRSFALADHLGKLYVDAPALPGAHQMANAALAIEMLRRQTDIEITETAVNRGLRAARWPARLQRLGNGPLTARLSHGNQIWLDGGHNPDAGAALAAHFRGTDARIHMIIGMLANKDPAAIVEPLADRIASLTVVPVPGHAHHGAESFGSRAVAAASVEAALDGLDMDPATDIVLICGSLYLAGTVLRANGEMPT